MAGLCPQEGRRLSNCEVWIRSFETIGFTGSIDEDIDYNIGLYLDESSCRDTWLDESVYPPKDGWTEKRDKMYRAFSWICSRCRRNGSGAASVIESASRRPKAFASRANRRYRKSNSKTLCVYPLCALTCG
jgi:hypothetical protein